MITRISATAMILLAIYRIAGDAELTVAVYANQSDVAANFVLDSEELTPERTNAIMKALTRMLP